MAVVGAPVTMYGQEYMPILIPIEKSKEEPKRTYNTYTQTSNTISSNNSSYYHDYSTRPERGCTEGCTDNCPNWVQRCVEHQCCIPKVMPVVCCCLALPLLIGGSVLLGYATNATSHAGYGGWDISALITVFNAIGIPCVTIGALCCVAASARFFRGKKCDKTCECPMLC